METITTKEQERAQQFTDLIGQFKKNSPEKIAFLTSITAAYISEHPEKTQETEEITDRIFNDFPVDLIIRAHGVACAMRGKFTIPGGEELLEDSIAYFERYFNRCGIMAE